MIKIHSTKKLIDKLPLDEKGMLISKPLNTDTRATEDSPLGDWHANLRTLQRHNCVLFIHDSTRFPVFVKELRKPDFANLAWHFEDGFMNTLLKAGADDVQMEAAANSLRPLQFDSDCNRSVQSTSTQRAGDIEVILLRKSTSLSEISAYQTSAWLSGLLTKIKGMKNYITPKQEMFALLDEHAKSSPMNITRKSTGDSAPYNGANNVVSIDKFRK